MYKHALITSGFILGLASVAFGQALDTPFQVRALVNLKGRDAIVATNSGAAGSNVTLCVNAYALSASTGELLDCCSCPVAPNSLVSIPIIADLLGNPKPKPKAVVVKLMASTGVGFLCETGAVGIGGNSLATGILAWTRDTPFLPATLSAGELNRLNTQCSTKHPGGNGCFACPL